jgi:LAO/AO transport system kinase
VGLKLTLSLRSLENLVESAINGNLRAMGRLLSILETYSEDAGRLLEILAKNSKGAHVIGVTGIPGAGKSTLISRMITVLRRRGYKVAVVAIDPSSPFSQGALMGDRLRMQEHATDPGVFIRSLSTHGLKGGLSLAALSIIEAFDALGYDKIIVETVGVGQAEVDIMHAAHTIVVVTMPGAGDDIQALKAGVMEIGDVYVVNKSDMPGATKTEEYLNFVIESGEIGSTRKGWVPKVIRTSAVMGQGIEELVDVIEDHYRFLKKIGGIEERIISRRTLAIRLLAERILVEALKRTAEEEKENLERIAREARGVLAEAERLAGEACRRLQGRG